MDGKIKSINISIERMKETKPFIFEADRGDGERFKVLWSKTNDQFF